MLIPPGYEPHLAAVTAAPFDDLPRLAMADWLDEHGGGEWAAYIREQVAEYDWSRPEWYQAEMVVNDTQHPMYTVSQILIGEAVGVRVFFSRGFPCAFGTRRGVPDCAWKLPITHFYLDAYGRIVIAIHPNGEVWVNLWTATYKVWKTKTRNIARFIFGRTFQLASDAKKEEVDDVYMSTCDDIAYMLNRTSGYTPPTPPTFS